MASSKLVKNIEESLVFDSNILSQTPSVLTALAINYNSNGKAEERYTSRHETKILRSRMI